jgi:hypothetical protein
MLGPFQKGPEYPAGSPIPCLSLNFPNQYFNSRRTISFLIKGDKGVTSTSQDNRVETLTCMALVSSITHPLLPTSFLELSVTQSLAFYWVGCLLIAILSSVEKSFRAMISVAKK